MFQLYRQEGTIADSEEKTDMGPTLGNQSGSDTQLHSDLEPRKEQLVGVRCCEAKVLEALARNMWLHQHTHSHC